eukprot:scaffold24466_cov32-Tisochrysis_lutea.AAC.1
MGEVSAMPEAAKRSQTCIVTSGWGFFHRLNSSDWASASASMSSELALPAKANSNAASAAVRPSSGSSPKQSARASVEMEIRVCSCSCSSTARRASSIIREPPPIRRAVDLVLQLDTARFELDLECISGGVVARGSSRASQTDQRLYPLGRQPCLPHSAAGAVQQQHLTPKHGRGGSRVRSFGSQVKEFLVGGGLRRRAVAL